MNIRNGEKIENNFSQEKRGKEKWVQKKIKTCTKFSRSIVITFYHRSGTTWYIISKTLFDEIIDNKLIFTGKSVTVVKNYENLNI